MFGRSLLHRASSVRAAAEALARRPPSRGLKQIAEKTYEQLVRREQVPTYALIIGSSALCFQVAVLFPWHEKLSEEFDALERVTAEIKRNAGEVDERMNALVALEQSVLRKEQSILQREEAIMRFEYEILSTAKQIVKDLDEVTQQTNVSSGSSTVASAATEGGSSGAH